ncbi:MAG: type II toxin-antitoxin system VapC family toxin [Rhodocyclaceae bacterium]|nr:type II toxin-antitoxin system VapC family toxin [Rhodocyclaceae bacterium]
MPFVVDNSVVAGWFLASQADDYTDGVLALLRADVAIVPPLWEYELANVARTAIARGVLSEKDARLAISYVLGLPISVDRTPVAPDRLLALAFVYGLTAYDAAYLELALRHRLSIAVRDGKLKAAAESSGIGIVVGP